MESSKKIIDKIKKENIKPMPKWYFVVPNTVIWLVFIILVFIGAAAFSVIILSIQQTDFDLISHITHSRIELILGLLPFFWIVVLLIFLVAAIFTFRKSKKGYKFGWPLLLGYSTLASILLGTLFFLGDGSDWLENTFAEQVSYYESIHEKKQKIWMKPEDGFLSGTIEKVDTNILQLIDFNAKKWDIDYKDVRIPQRVFLEKGTQIKLIGKITSVNTFQAKELRPWNGKNGQKKGMKRRNKAKN